jgi:subtilisin-like proprotein convertase family protein
MRQTNITAFILVLMMMSAPGAFAGDAEVGAIVQQTWSSTVGQQIPDGPSGGGARTPLLDTINVPLGSIVSGVEVYLNISMVDWTSDLIVRLTSPGGTQLGLAWVGGGGIPATNIVGWFPADFTPHDDMDAWIGEYTEGDWVLDCQDYSNGYVGTLNSWQLRISYDEAVATENESWGDTKALYR